MNNINLSELGEIMYYNEKKTINENNIEYEKKKHTTKFNHTPFDTVTGIYD